MNWTFFNKKKVSVILLETSLLRWLGAPFFAILFSASSLFIFL